MTDKYEVYQDKRGEWRWRRKAANGRIVGASIEGYDSRKAAEAGLTRGPMPSDRWEIYQDRRGEWRWRRASQNGRIIGASTIGFGKKSEAEANAARQGFEQT